ncbi:Sulfite reduction-associated complex DsrMKJOP protein DsrM (= HmeC) [hydrothermal vent metagenome]|uniref:Sulfite reduction-associated complex DsrMKJOP protein DsrM (= HmeC) n=1 Tax=hydrothermal vent metagenome TaxID=652676 RepID=A0A3B1C5G1_9ZZZZ
MEGVTWVSIIFIALSYFVFLVFIIGFLRKIYIFASTPAPLKIPVTPAPVTRKGVVLRMAGEVLLFTSLFKGNKWTWLGGYVFHATLALALARHLRYFLEPVPALVILAGPPGVWAGVILIMAAGYLFVRRIAVDRVRYISTGADYLALALIALIAWTGLMMKFVMRVDVLSVKAFMMGLVTFSPVNMPADPVFIAHLTLVLILLVYLPFSKLMHMGGLFFSPTRYQVDDSREQRHVNPWRS